MPNRSAFVAPARWASLVLALLLLPAWPGTTAPAHAQSLGPQEVLERAPSALRPWAAWVTRDRPDHACPWIGPGRACVWHGALDLELLPNGAGFSLAVHLDAPGVVLLPGDTRWWPQDVRVNGAPAVLHAEGGNPAARLAAGTHRVTGQLQWERLPDRLPLPQAIGLVRLREAGGPWRAAQRAEDGSLALRAVREAEPTERQPPTETLDIDVVRLLVDDVPQRLETRIRLRAGGAPREVELARVLPEGFTATGIDAPIPTELTADGGLTLQLRPGDWTITLLARSQTDQTDFRPVAAAAPWPSRETWALDTRPNRRTVETRGVSATDPRQTSAPQAWHTLPVFSLQDGDTLTLVVLHRGESAPPAPVFRVQRDIRLSLDGAHFLIRDTVDAERSDRTRLTLHPPAELGRADVQGTDVPITRLGDDANPGFEVRHESFQMSADVLQPRTAPLAAVGWDLDAQHLNATLHLPPGWMLLTASGVDAAPTAWVQGWRLIDIFLLLLIAFGLRALFGNGIGALALVVLGLAWHTPLLPQWLWLPFLITAAIAHALAQKPQARIAWGLHVCAAAFLLLATAGHLGYELQTALFPALENRASGPEGQGRYAADRFARVGERSRAPMPAGADSMESIAEESYDLAVQQRGALRSAAAPAPLIVLDPTAQLQTGPGMPTWQWNRHPLTWSGPVASSQSLRLLLLPPWLVTLLRLLAAFGLVALLGWLARQQIVRWRERPSAEPTPTPEPDASPPDDDAWEPDASPPDSAAPDGPAPTGAGALVIAGLVGLALAVAAPAPHAAADAFPTPPLLQELRSALLADPACGNACIETQSLDIHAAGDTLTLRAEVHAQTAGAWRAPGPLQAWSPLEVLLNGEPTRALRRGADHSLEVRVPPGVHRIELRGVLVDRLTLNLPHRPRVLRWTTEGWLLDGPRADAPPPSAIHLSRDASGSAESPPERGVPPQDAGVRAELAPALTLHRTLEISHEGAVHYVLERDGGTQDAVRVRIPRLPGEQLASDGVEAEEDAFVVTLDREQASAQWSTTLAPRERLLLRAAEDAPYLEVWNLHCTTLWSCRTEGIPPVLRMAPGGDARTWRPTWRPWPGEELTLHLARPEGVEGQTITVDQATLHITDGRRLREVALTAELRTSHGGRWSVTLPNDAQLQRVTLQGRELPARAENGVLTFTLPVGQSTLRVEWQLEASTRFRATTPAVTLDGGATHLQLHWQPSSSRWLLWTHGPRWGPVVTLWHWLPVLLLLALLLGRFAPTPLSAGAWLLLGLGMTQISWLAPLAVVLWLLALAARERIPPSTRWRHNLAFLGILLLTCLASAALAAAILRGLALRPPDMQVLGGGSSDNLLRWYVDRTSGPFPQATLLSAPLWAWHLTMLAWALWLATSLVRWVRWGWNAVSKDGLWRKGTPGERKPRVYHPVPNPKSP